MEKKTVIRYEATVVSETGRKFRKVFPTVVEAEAFAVGVHQSLREGGVSKVSITKLSLADNGEEIARLDRAAQTCPPGAVAAYLQAIAYASKEKTAEDEVYEEYNLA